MFISQNGGFGCPLFIEDPLELDLPKNLANGAQTAKNNIILCLGWFGVISLSFSPYFLVNASWSLIASMIFMKLIPGV